MFTKPTANCLDSFLISVNIFSSSQPWPSLGVKMDVSTCLKSLLLAIRQYRNKQKRFKCITAAEETHWSEWKHLSVGLLKTISFYLCDLTNHLVTFKLFQSQKVFLILMWNAKRDVREWQSTTPSFLCLHNNESEWWLSCHSSPLMLRKKK